jgi:hypothetical protein
MENNKEVSTTEIVEEVKTDAVVKEEPQKEEPKKEKLYTRAEVENIKKAEREIILKEQEIKRTEAEKLAKMDADEKHKYELEKATKEKEEALSKLNAYELKEEASKIAREKGVPQSLLNIIDYTKENAESIKTKIEEIEVVYKQALQEGINDRMKEKTPKTVVEETTQINKPRASF